MNNDPIRIAEPVHEHVAEPRGRTEITEEVAMQIAGFAAKRVEGIHRLGKASVLSRLTRGGEPGVTAAVGEYEVAFDLEVVVDYGVSIVGVVDELRRRIGETVKTMLDRSLVELNIHVVGIEFPDADNPPHRVR